MKHLSAYENVAMPCTTDGKILAFGILPQTNTLFLHEDSTFARALGTVLTDNNYKDWRKNRTNVLNKIEINY
jgi:hypothetical protein